LTIIFSNVKIAHKFEEIALNGAIEYRLGIKKTRASEATALRRYTNLIIIIIIIMCRSEM